MPSPAASARFVLAPAALAGAAGWLRRAAATMPVDASAVQVDVVIHAGRDRASIAYCLAGLCAQTLRPRRVRLVEDAAVLQDGTATIAREFARMHGLRLETVALHGAGGAVSIAGLQANALDGDVLVVLDARTVLDSPDWLARCVDALQRDPRAAAACGVRLPLGDADRRRWAQSDPFRRWLGGDDWRDPLAARDAFARVSRRLADAHGECAGLVQRRFVEVGHARLFGGIGRPSGAVAYRRRALAAVAASMPHAAVDAFSLGAAFASAGLRIVPVPGAVAREHGAHGCMGTMRARYQDTQALLGAVWPPARRAPGRGVLRALAFDRIAVPAVALALLLAGQGALLVALMAVEATVWLAALAVVVSGPRRRALAAGLAALPLRWLDLAIDSVAAGAFACRRLRQRSEWPVAS
ncbi:glycosyltransferase family A protein [Cognatilysobacter bugurensis]|uniref:Glycosyltransferase 2-like domain-containing protein n=1 Tax=Cognatilysobacter bugurensis TaxID=543356 RepID=A0A918T3U5_9GAMM|nr:glycosyltransferase family A protein [Lysobacter bugurensis]GHA88316.1 hypothetical protein GCM10007067_27940 [Lysobacter bugurensis]